MKGGLTPGDALDPLALKPRVRRSRQSQRDQGRQPVIDPLVFLPIFIAMLVGIYTNIPLNIGVEIPGFFALVPGMTFLFLMRKQAQKIGFYTLLVLVCAAVPTMFGVLRHNPIADVATNFGGFLLSVLAATGLYLAVLDQDRRFICRILVIAAAVIGIGVVLEVLFPPFGALSDTVRKIIYSGRFIYASDARDIALYGHIRPKVFAQEPSFPARFMAYTLACVLATAIDNWTRIIAAFLFLVCIFLISSPSIYAGFIILGMLFVALRLARARFDMSALNALIFTGAAAIILAVVNFPIMVGMLGHNRAAAIQSGKDSSAAMRMLIPPQIFYASLDRYGPLGSGLGSKQELQAIAGPIFFQYAGALYMKDPDGNWDWTNALIDVFIEFGPIFGTIFLLLLTRAFPTPFPGVTIIAFEAVFMLDAGLPGPKNWAYFALVVSCLSIAIKDYLATIAAPRRRARQET